jgi:hypothetical protein
MLPRYFTPRSDSSPSRVRPATIAGLLDAFLLSGRGRTARDAAVVEDLLGGLHVIDDEVPQILPADTRATFSHHEMTNGGLRAIDAQELWLFDLQMVEQLADTPGVNDPVWLYGRLYGPFPGPAEPTATDGQLTVTRADLLAGFVDGFPHATRHPQGRCFGLALPGDTPDAIAQGHGMVLAWPLVPAELRPPDPANEAACAEILHDVLAATRLDLERAGIDHPLCRAILPVPNRADLVAELEREGWIVQGDTAIQANKVTRSGLGSLLTSVLGAPDGMSRKLPPEAGIEAFVDLARETLAAFPGWPDARHAALRARFRDRRPRGAVQHVLADPTPPPAPHTPRAQPTPRPPTPPPAVSPRTPPGTPDWMGDFVNAHKDAAHPPRLTRPGPKRTDSGSIPKKPGWMDDFEDR